METALPIELKKTKSFFQSVGYSKKFRKDVHILLNFGYKQVRATIDTNTHEPTITGRVAKEIGNGLEQIGLLPEDVLKPHYVVIPEESNIKATDPKNIKDKFIRLDIVILNNQKRPYKRYVIEAKRLRKDRFKVDKYREDGVMRFIDELYASDSPEAIMVGFWQDEDAKHWFGELAREFEENETTMAFAEKLSSFNVIPEISDEWVTVHQRKSGNKIILFHILLDCL